MAVTRWTTGAGDDPFPGRLRTPHRNGSFRAFPPGRTRPRTRSSETCLSATDAMHCVLAPAQARIAAI